MTWILLNKRISLIIALFLCLLISLCYANLLKGQLNKAATAQTNAVAKAIKPYETAIAKAQTEKARLEKQYSENLLKAEQNAIEKIKAANADAHSADLAANSLSKQLDKAKRNLPSASTKTIIEYIDTSSDVLEHCVAEYRTMAKSCDAERIDKERLSDGWPVY